VTATAELPPATYLHRTFCRRKVLQCSTPKVANMIQKVFHALNDGPPSPPYNKRRKSMPHATSVVTPILSDIAPEADPAAIPDGAGADELLDALPIAACA